MDDKKYVVGIDVGTYSVGMAAIEVDDRGIPIRILNACSTIHDSALDPNGNKTATSRKAASGVARRTRRLYRRRRQRLAALDAFIEKQGWPKTNLEDYKDPYFPWKIRAELATRPINDKAELEEKLSVALRHIARHRGWRNPYTRIESLYKDTAPSDSFIAIKEEISNQTGAWIAEDSTVAQMLTASGLQSRRLRKNDKKDGLICARLQQSDHAMEIKKIFQVQGLDNDLFKKTIKNVFAAESPKGKATELAGKDPLQPSLKRAIKASDAFQKYRIAALIGNLRIDKEPLSLEQRNQIFDFLLNYPASKNPTWLEVAELLGINRGRLRGTATITDDGEKAGAQPPIHTTNKTMLTSKIKPLSVFWKEANELERRAILKALCNAEKAESDTPAGALVEELLTNLDDSDLEKLENLKLQTARAAYSEDTLERLTKRMMEQGLDLYEARLEEFNISKDWVPPKPDIGEPLGNPAVDRVLKIVARWLNAAENKWGIPEQVTIEHVRDGLMSESETRKLNQEIQKRTNRNLSLMEAMQKELNISGRPRRSDLWRYQSIQRQNCQCAYCGSEISFKNSEMDHIIPRAGQGSSNVRENLLATCHTCNLDKGKTPFAVWAEQCNRPGVSIKDAVERVKYWVQDSGLDKKSFEEFKKAVISRLRQTVEDEELDNRSIESVAWMANELRARIAQRFRLIGTDEFSPKVSVYRGGLTAEARFTADFERHLHFIGSFGKTRLDRRHHAVDAAVVSLLSPYVAETLAQKIELRKANNYTGRYPEWREYDGKDIAHKSQYQLWKHKMSALRSLLQVALDEDRIPVFSNKRLRLGNGRAHEETIGKLLKFKVGDEISASTIDRAESEALWCALTRHPDFDSQNGLPANPERTIRLRDKYLNAQDTIEFFPKAAASIAVRGGYAEIGAAFHHARIYRINGTKPVYAMLRIYTLDLQKYRNEDLFSVELLPQTISMRQAEPKLRKALAEGKADYLGWIVIDDEIYVDTSGITTGQLGTVQQLFGPIKHWKIDGFCNDTKLRLRPSQISAEGIKKLHKLDTETLDHLEKILDKTGWRPSVNTLLSLPNATIIRRNALGEPRLSSRAHLPISWRIDKQ